MSTTKNIKRPVYTAHLLCGDDGTPHIPPPVVVFDFTRQDLLEFTRGLDFGKYIKDAEVQSMIDQVKKRIIELEGQPEEDEEGLGDDDDNSDMDGSTGRETDALDETEARLQVCCS